MMSLLISGVCVLATSHATRQKREADYALAMQMAEAGINYELRYISTHLSSTPAGHLSTGKYYSGANPITGVAGSFEVYVTNTDGTTNWTTPNDVKIVATGNVGGTYSGGAFSGGISRTVTVVCKSTGGGGMVLFDNSFAVFGTQSLLFTQASNVVNGNMGANGPPSGVSYSVNTQSNGVINVNSTSPKPLVLAGGATLIPGNSVNPNTTNNPGQIETRPQPVPWPTVDEIVQGTFASGWSTLSATSAVNAQWNRIRTFKTQSRSLTPAGTKAITFTAGSTVLNDAVMKTKSDDGQWVNALILPPGDYYFTSISLVRTNGYSGPAPVIYFDTAAVTTGGTPGPVRIWVGGTSTTADTLNLDIQYTSGLDSDKAKYSRIFYGKPANITITGNNNFAGVYAVRKAQTAGVSPATVTLTQNSKITGAVIADNVVMTGGAIVSSPSAPMSNSTDYTGSGGGSGGGNYGFANGWKEVNVTQTGAVFADGTNR